MKSKIALVFLLVSAAVTAGAQDRPSFFRSCMDIIDRLADSGRNLDSVYVLRPALRWDVALDGTGIRTGADLYSDITVTDLTESNPQTVSGTLRTGMQKRLYKKIGAGISYGGLSLSYGVEVDRESPRQNRYFTLGSTGSYYGAQIQYYSTHEYVEGSLDIENVPPVTLTSLNPCQVRDLTIDAFYAFNRKKFVYSAAYTGRLVQQRSAGSWMVAAKFLQGDFRLDDIVLSTLLNGLNRYSTLQVQLGGGYSYNWTVVHRAPEDLRTWKGLRNLTVNATVLPMVSLYHDIHVEQGAGEDLKRTRYAGQPVFSPTVRCAVGYAWNRYHVNVSASYNRFSFHGADTLLEEDGGYLRTKGRTKGVFYDLTAKVQVSVRF